MPETNEVGNWLAHKIPDGGSLTGGDRFTKFLFITIMFLVGLGVFEAFIPHEHNPPFYKSAGWQEQ